jgi:hypothetical protein
MIMGIPVAAINPPPPKVDFCWHAAKAIIFVERGGLEQAANYVGQAFDADQIEISGFRLHQNLGLVGKEYKGLEHEIRAIHA